LLTLATTAVLRCFTVDRPRGGGTVVTATIPLPAARLTTDVT
jgi:hypothetical protein